MNIKPEDFKEIIEGARRIHFLRDALIKDTLKDIELTANDTINLRILYRDLCIKYFEPTSKFEFPLTLTSNFTSDVRKLKNCILGVYPTNQIEELITIEKETEKYYIRGSGES